MGSCVPITSRRVLGFVFFGGEGSASQLPRVLFFQYFRFLKFVFDHLFFEFSFFGSFSIFRHRTLCPGDGNRQFFRKGESPGFPPRSREPLGFPPRRGESPGFPPQEQEITGFSTQVHRVFHPGAGNHRVFRPGAPGFPPRCTGFSTQENGKSLRGEGRVGGN